MIINGVIQPFPEDGAATLASNFGEHQVHLAQFLPEHAQRLLKQEPYYDLGLHQIINFLYTVGQRWKSEEYGRSRIYIRELKKFLGYSEQMAKLEANWISMLLCSKSALYDIVKNELGSRHIMDEWTPQDECYMRAYAKGRSLHLLAGNVPLSGITSIVLGILTKNQCIVKTASADPFTAHSLAMSCIDVDPKHPITRSLSVLYWPHGQEPSTVQTVMQRMDVVIAWGGQGAIEWAVRHAPTHE